MNFPINEGTRYNENIFISHLTMAFFNYITDNIYIYTFTNVYIK